MKYSFKRFQKDSLIKFLSLEKYIYIRNNLYNVNVYRNDDFQTVFNSFYKVRRDNKWRKEFYTYFEHIKNNLDITFEEILDYIYKKTGNIEASFSSKLLSSINPNMPIWDQYVLKNLDLEVTGNTKEEKLENTKILYYKIISEEQKLLKDTKVKKEIKKFRKYLPEYDLTDIRILDYIIWSKRDNIED